MSVRNYTFILIFKTQFLQKSTFKFNQFLKHIYIYEPVIVARFAQIFKIQKTYLMISYTLAWSMHFTSLI